MNTADLAISEIRFLDLIAPHAELEEELVEVFRQALHSASFVGGPMVEEFEAAFAEFCGAEHCVGVSSGTDALRFALIASGIRQGDVVVTVPNTFIATTEAITQAGGIPEFVDIDECTYNLSVEKLREYLEKKCTLDEMGQTISVRSRRPVTGIVPVHLYGQMADMDPILELAEQYHLVVIEDACQAHGAEYFSRKLNRWMKAGSMGRAAAFSFYPGKNLGACGEGGAVTTNDPILADKVKMLRDHGQTKKYHHDLEGYNGRLDAIQAGILLAKLPSLDQWNAQRRHRATEYCRLFEDNGEIVVPHQLPWSRSVFHLYVIRAINRDALLNHLKTEGIGTGLHYPVPLHLQRSYASLNYNRGDYPVTEAIAEEIISLPMFPQLTDQQQAKVVREIAAFSFKLNGTRVEAKSMSLATAEQPA